MSKNILSDPINYDVESIIFSEPEEKKLPNDPSVKYFRVGIKTKNPDGTVGDLILGLDRSTSFGISTKYGVSMSIVLQDREGPSDRQNKTIDVFKAISEKCKDFLLSKKALIKKPKLERFHLDDISPVKYKIDEKTGEIDSTRSPTLSVKLLTKNKDDAGNSLTVPKISTGFYSEPDENGESESVDPMDYENKRCFVTCAVKIDGIFIGQMTKLQCKLVECEIKSADAGPKRLLPSWRTAKPVQTKITTEEPLRDEEDFEADTDVIVKEEPVSKLAASDNEEEEVEEKPKGRRGRGKN